MNQEVKRTADYDAAVEKAQATGERIIASVSEAVVGKEKVLRLLLTALVADGHILIEDVPGVAKTLTASSFAQTLGLSFARIQFMPDLLPGDITGGFLYNPSHAEFDFKPGPIFANVILADEVNRGTPKTQAALLEAMEERQVTVEGHTYTLEPPFLVVATQNPVEFEGTYDLPEAQLDRFLIRLEIGYPAPADEVAMLARRAKRRRDRITLEPVLSRDEFLQLQQATEHVYVSPDIQDYIVSLCTATRRHPKVRVGASPRGSLAMFKLARAYAVFQGRDFTLPEDVKAIAVSALAHRLLLDPATWSQRLSPQDIIEEILSKTPTPPPNEGPR